MNEYTLISANLHEKNDAGVDCFCALGVYLSEKGHSPAAIDERQYTLFTEGHDADLTKLIEVLDLHTYHDDDLFKPVYRANDRYDWNNETKTATFNFAAEQFEAAFKSIGMDVKLNDKRADKWNRAAESNDTST